MADEVDLYDDGFQANALLLFDQLEFGNPLKHLSLNVHDSAGEREAVLQRPTGIGDALNFVNPCAWCLDILCGACMIGHHIDHAVEVAAGVGRNMVCA